MRGYIKGNPDDYATVVKAIAYKRSLSDQKFAMLEGSHMRALFEIPEKLMQSLILGLDEEGTIWMRTNEGGRWFAREFPDFAVATVI